MANFGLEELAQDKSSVSSTAPDLSTRLASFKATPPRRIDTAIVDAAAAPHGFTSREPTPPKRRRVAPREPRPNNMGIRLSDREKERFVGFADKHKLQNYSEAIVKLLDIADGNS
jgi:hypothetical protein